MFVCIFNLWVSVFFLFFKQKTAYDMLISDWSSDVCSSDLAAVIGASVLLWAVHWLVLRGIREAAFINLVTTIAKVVPLLLFVLIAVFAFRLDIFTADIWGLKNPDLGSVMKDRKSVVQGKRVTERLDRGGPRIVKKQQ